jgi:hypothetical protein
MKNISIPRSQIACAVFSCTIPLYLATWLFSLLLLGIAGLPEVCAICSWMGLEMALAFCYRYFNIKQLHAGWWLERYGDQKWRRSRQQPLCFVMPFVSLSFVFLIPSFSLHALPFPVF